MDCRSPMNLLAETTASDFNLMPSPPKSRFHCSGGEQLNFAESPIASHIKQNAFDIAEVKSSPRLDVLTQVAECTEKQKKRRQPPNPEKKSNYRGVSWQKTSKAWVAQYKTAGRTTYLGLFGTEQEAAKAYDVAIYLKGGKNLNFGLPSEEAINQFKANGNVPAGRLGATVLKKTEGDKKRHTSESADATEAVPDLDDPKFERGATSHFRGVSWYASRQIWKASIQVNRKKEYIGRFETEEEAARAYNKRATELRGADAVLNIVPDTVTRYPTIEIPEKTKKRSKRSSQDDNNAASAEESNSNGLPPMPTRKRARKDELIYESRYFHNFMPATPTIPDIGLATPRHLTRSAENSNGTNQFSISKPTFDEAEMVAALAGSVDHGLIDSPGSFFTSPLPLNPKRGVVDPTPIPMSAPSAPNTGFRDGIPLLQNIFDSPAPDFHSFTPSNLTQSNSRYGRKSLLTPFT